MSVQVVFVILFAVVSAIAETSIRFPIEIVSTKVMMVDGDLVIMHVRDARSHAFKLLFKPSLMVEDSNPSILVYRETEKNPLPSLDNGELSSLLRDLLDARDEGRFNDLREAAKGRMLSLPERRELGCLYAIRICIDRIRERLTTK